MARRGLLALIAAGVLGYAAICAWMYAQQRALMYYPQFTRTDARQTDFGLARDGVMLKGWRVNGGKPGDCTSAGNAERVEDSATKGAGFPTECIP